MALAAAARRSLASRLSGCLQPAIPHLLTSHRSGDAATPPTPHHPASPLLRSPHFPIHQSSRTAAQTQTQTLFPFGIHLAGAAQSRRGFSSSPSYRMADAADAVATPVAPASFPSEVGWIAEDSSLSVAAVQHLIDAVHSFTGLNWWLSIAVSTVLLRSMLLTLVLSTRKKFLVVRPEFDAVQKLFGSVDDDESLQEALKRLCSLFKRRGLFFCIAFLHPYTFMALYYAIANMVETLPSLKEGGAFWFTDLTTPDALPIHLSSYDSTVPHD